MKDRRVWLCLCTVVIAACQRPPKTYPIPAQRHQPVANDPPPSGGYVKFADFDAGDYIVRDINPGGAVRWTRDHPEMRFRVEPRLGLRFSMDFAIADTTFRDTGPVTVTVEINGHALGIVRCPRPRDYHFEQPVPTEWLRPGEPVMVVAEASPLWTAPKDGAHLGYVISEAGFR
jgi:hypothetical protein